MDFLKICKNRVTRFFYITAEMYTTSSRSTTLITKTTNFIPKIHHVHHKMLLYLINFYWVSYFLCHWVYILAKTNQAQNLFIIQLPVSKVKPNIVTGILFRVLYNLTASFGFLERSYCFIKLMLISIGIISKLHNSPGLL